MNKPPREAMIPDQIKMWDKKHGKNDHAGLRGAPSPLAKLSEPHFPKKSRVLELGCGVGRDAVYFTEKGHTVLATDGSETVIRQNKEHGARQGVAFAVLDMQQPLPYADGEWDVVYANLSLHYYLDEKTRQIVADIARVLRAGGILAFACKSKDEQRTKDAHEVEPAVYVAPNGHATHMFTTAYAENLMAESFDIVWLDEVTEEYSGHASDIVRCIARKREADA